jgi:hypothetical protein
MGKLFTLLAVSLLALSVLATVVSAETDTPWPGVINACVNVKSGLLHVITVPNDCSPNEIMLHWNVQGPLGPQGAPGP